MMFNFLNNITKSKRNILIFNYFLITLVALSPYFVFASTQEVSIGASLCGNGVIDSGEECDGSNLAGQTCVSRGYNSGPLSCNSNCTINVSACVSGGGGGTTPLLGNIILSGRAYPGKKVITLKDAQVVASTITDPAANFRITVSGLSSGNYIFGIYSEDNKGTRSSLITYPVAITSGVAVELSNIFIAPTIYVDKDEVKRGDNIAIFGQSAPSSEITIAVNSEEEIFVKTPTDNNGIYLYNFDTSPLTLEQHSAKSKSTVGGAISSFSNNVTFLVGTKNVIKKTEKILKGDINGDNRVNLVDFSIAAYWYKRPNPPTSTDLNGDGKVDLVDFSIMAFYWTG